MHLDVKSAPVTVSVCRCRLKCRYVGTGSHLGDFGCVRADHPLPAAAPVSYFEVRLESYGVKGVSIRVGLAPASFDLLTGLGSSPSSIGLRTDGRVFSPDFNSGRRFCSGWSIGDTIGCGVCTTSGRVFFTKNGTLLGTSARRPWRARR